MLLSVENLSAGYGKRQVLTNVSLKVANKTVTTIFGHNGAGKSTTLKTIMGMSSLGEAGYSLTIPKLRARNRGITFVGV